MEDSSLVADYWDISQLMGVIPKVMHTCGFVEGDPR